MLVESQSTGVRMEMRVPWHKLVPQVNMPLSTLLSFQPLATVENPKSTLLAIVIQQLMGAPGLALRYNHVSQEELR